MPDQQPLPQVFIGSSSEGLEVARNLDAELGSGLCEVVRWDRDVFEPSGYPLESLLQVALVVDFAVLVATPDDVTSSRGDEQVVPRDNVMLEFGLFAGALGRNRTYLLATGGMKLPTDVLGLTRLPFRLPPSGNVRAAVGPAALEIEKQVKALGRYRGRSPSVGPHATESALLAELSLLRGNAEAQGWVVRKDSATTLRLRRPDGRVFTMEKRQPEITRIELRRFAAKLRASGLRVNGSLRRPVSESPI